LKIGVIVRPAAGQATSAVENKVNKKGAVFPYEVVLQISLVLVFLFIFFFFYPPTYAISDEAIYFSMAHVISHGNLFPDQSGYFVPGTVSGPQHPVSKLPLGWPLLLSPLSKFGWRFFFLLPLSLHLIGFYYFRKILNLFEIDTAFSFLYLLFPTFVFHSRTLMSDLPAAVFFLIGFYYSIQNQKRSLIFAGICFGISLWMRYASLVLITPLIAVLFFRDLKWKVIPLLCAFAPFVMLLAVYNYFALGNPFLVGHLKIGIPLQTSFSFEYLLQHLPKYFLYLNLIFPLMGISLLFYHGKRKVEIFSCVITLLLFYSAYFWFDSGTSFIQTAIKSLRFLLPIIPLLLVSYLYCLDSYIFRKIDNSKKWGLAIACSMLLMVVTSGIEYKHQEYLQRQKHFSDFIYKQTPENSAIIANMEVIELLQTVWGRRKIVEYDLSAITAATKESDTYLITNNKAEKPLLKAQNVSFFPELQKRYSVKEVSNIKDQGWELSVYKLYTLR
jgi:hypothetical protein